MKKGSIFLVPNQLSVDSSHDMVIPEGVRNNVGELRSFAVESIREARRFLRRIHKDFDIDGSTFFELNKRSRPEHIEPIIAHIEKGNDLGIISDAGCPGIADPGGLLVRTAQSKGIRVIPYTGPSSILLALMASGMNGQEFRFSGYLPKGQKDRIAEIKKLETTVRRTGETQLFMDTPFRNEHVITDILETCEPNTLFCIACNITDPDQFIITRTIGQWREMTIPRVHKKPCIFLLGR
jgi:16S rRNA (cytidine1402-2'-O)-methyltransferase